ncbi:MAG: hypothetical protein ACK5Q5_18970 [Planctomycetaceae bacterium]
MALVPCDIALADDIVRELNTRWSPGTFTAERTWVPEWDSRTELESLSVAVQPTPNPTGVRWERQDAPRELWPIDVGFAKRLTAKNRGEIDELLTIVDEVREWLQFQQFTLTDGRTFVSQGFEFQTRFEPELIRRQFAGTDLVYAGVFLSVVRFPFERLP